MPCLAPIGELRKPNYWHLADCDQPRLRIGVGTNGQRKVPYANWNRGKQQANLNADEPDNANDNWGPRCGLGGQRFLPAAQHATDFVSGGLALEYLGLINNFQLQAQPELQGSNLKMGTSLN